MITIKTIPDKYGRAELHIQKDTPYSTILLGIEMLIEHLVNTTNSDIDNVLSDLKRIYTRDNKEKLND